MIAMRDASKFVLMSGFFEELRRRKVYRVAAAYIIAAGFIIQIGSAVFPAWELPNWTFRLLVTILLIGFPVALILALAFDVRHVVSRQRHTQRPRYWQNARCGNAFGRQRPPHRQSGACECAVD